jgi:hypothetical protein
MRTDIDTDSEAWRAIVTGPPLRDAKKTCYNCPIKHQCYINDAGRLPCEALSVKEICLADAQGLLNETIWWRQLPRATRATDVLRWNNVPETTVQEVDAWLKIQERARTASKEPAHG